MINEANAKYSMNSKNNQLARVEAEDEGGKDNFEQRLLSDMTKFSKKDMKQIRSQLQMELMSESLKYY